MKLYSHFRKGADIYRTTWETSSSTEKYTSNKDRVITKYKYLGKVKVDKYDDPNDTINGMSYDVRARGRRRSFEMIDYVWSNKDTFRFGKYNGKKIKDVKDINYTAWYWKQIDGDHADYVKNYLEDEGCEFRDKGNYVYVATPDDIQKEQDKRAHELAHKQNMMDRFNRNNQILLTIDKNPNSSGEIEIKGIVYKFPKVVARYYQGWTYYVPVQNGKAKRVKGKVINAHIWPLDGVFYIAKFEILKDQ